MKYIKSLSKLIFLLVLFSNCKNTPANKIECYASSLRKLQKERIYDDVIKSASYSLVNLKNRDGKRPYKDSSIIVSSEIDKTIFFNKDRNKCLLLMLQKTSSDLKIDQVQIVQGTLKNNSWTFSYDRLPDIPEITLTVKKHIQNKKSINNTFNYLSIAGQEFVLTAGTTIEGNCKIDEKYWFGN